jgi:hypothetical protein
MDWQGWANSVPPDVAPLHFLVGGYVKESVYPPPLQCLKIRIQDSYESIHRRAGLGYGLDDRGFESRQELGTFHHRVQNGSGAHPASYAMGTGGSFPGCKMAGV